MLAQDVQSESAFYFGHFARSSKASRRAGNWNSKPDFSKRPGITRRLLMSNSVSVRRRNAPISSIQFVAAKPKGTPQTSRRIRIISAFGIGLGETRLTG